MTSLKENPTTGLAPDTSLQSKNTPVPLKDIEMHPSLLCQESLTG